MLLTCNQDTLQVLSLASPLTEEARRFMCAIPNLRQLGVFIRGPTLLPPVALPDLRYIYIDWDSGRDWLQGLRGATIGKLRTVILFPNSRSAQIDGFLEEFESVALTTSLPDTLSKLEFRTLQSWTPSYPSLLVFKKMQVLEIQFSCHNGCSSTVDDDTVTSLARAMPRLKILQLGGVPCSALTGVTLRGLVTLARHCPQLSKLRIHFQANRSAEVTSTTEPPSLSEPIPGIPQTNCALTDLEVGETPISEQETLAAGLTLLQIFPEIVNIEYKNPQWKSVVEAVELFKQIGGHIHHASKTYLSPLR